MKRHALTRIWAAVMVLAVTFAAPLATRAEPDHTIYVKGTQDEVLTNGNCTLREAILAANGDIAVDACPAGVGADVIIIPPGIYPLQLVGLGEDGGTSGDLDITAALMLKATGRGAIIQGFGEAYRYDERDRSLDVHSGAGRVILQKITIQGGAGGQDGSGIRNAADLRLDDCTINDNGSPNYDTINGGGIYNLGSLELVRSTLRGNHAYEGAGLNNEGTVSISASQFLGNEGDDGFYAGGIYNSGWMFIQGSNFSGNYSGGGSAIYNKGWLKVEDTHLDHNSARFTAPAVWNSGTAELVNISADGGYAGHYVGAILNSGVMTITRATISDNLSYDFSGAISQNSGSLYIEDAEINNNTTNGNGGALYIEGGNVTLIDVHLNGNKSEYHSGGAIYAVGDTLRIENSAVNDNSAFEYGGGIYSTAKKLILNRVEVNNNRARQNDGGGIYQAGGLLSLFASQVENNQAAQNGGGIYLTGQGEIDHATINGNSADLDGAGLYNTGQAYVWDAQLHFNTAMDAGGGIYNNGGLTLVGSSVAGNWGWGGVDWVFGGGGIANLGGLEIDASTIASNGTISTGAGISNIGTTYIRNSTLNDNISRDWAGGIWQGGGSLDVVNSTFTNNRGDAGGGGLGLEGGTANLQNVTMNGNSLALGWRNAAGGGVKATGGELTVHNTVIAGSWDYFGGTAGNIDCYLDGAVVFNNLGYNLVGIVDGCNWSAAPGDLTGSLAAPLDARLLPLQLAGGNVAVLPPMHTSPVIDAGDPLGCPLDDQRQVARSQGANCDIGAVEAVRQPISIDIRPGLNRNLIDRTSPHRVAVAIFSSPTFQPATQIDRSTITFGHTGLESSLYYLNTKSVCSSADLNGDGQPDLVCEFVIAQTGFQCGDTLGYLKAYSADRKLIAGEDGVLILPCK